MNRGTAGRPAATGTATAVAVRSEGEGFGGGPFGVRRPLRFLAYKLELDEKQVAELARILDDLKTERAQGEVDRRRSLSGFADAVAGPTFDAARAKESAALRVATAERLRDAVTAALGRLHALLDNDQRERLAYLIRTGVFSALATLPERRAINGTDGPISASDGGAISSPDVVAAVVLSALGRKARARVPRTASWSSGGPSPTTWRSSTTRPSVAGSIRASSPTVRWRSIRRRRCFTTRRRCSTA